MAAGLQNNSIRAVLDKQNLSAADQQRPGGNMRRETPPTCEIPSPGKQPLGLRQQRGLIRIVLQVTRECP